MSASQHDETENQLAALVPCAREAVVLPWDTDADANATISRHDLEEKVEDGKVALVTIELSAFDDHDEEEGDDDGPHIMR